MRAQPYRKNSRTNDDRVPTDAVVTEALALRAASRPPKAPPKLLVSSIPRMPKAGKRRRRRTI